jgi:hypothetical protein
MNNGIIISDSVALILGILIIGISIFSPGRKLPFRIFNFYIFSLTLFSLQSLLLETKFIYKIPHVFKVTMPFRYLLGPMLYLFIRTLLLNESKFRKYDWLHLIPFVFNYFILLPYLTSSTEVKLEVIKSFQDTAILKIPSFNSPYLNPRWHDALNQISYLVYNIVTVIFYIKFRGKNKTTIEINNRPIYSFAKLIVIILSIGNIILIASAFILSDTQMVLFVRIVVSCILAFFAITLILNPEFLYGTNHILALKSNRNKLLSQINSEEAKLIAMSNSNNESNVFLGLDYRVLYFNSLARQEFANIFDKELNIGIDFKEFIYPDYLTKFYSSFTKAVSGTRNEYHALSSINKEEKQWHLISFTPIYDNHHLLIGISVTTKNIDQEINAQIKTRQYIKDLEDIAWKEVHLLNVPISNLLGITKLLLKPESDISVEEQDILINHISIEVERLDIVIQDIVERVSETVKHAPN